MRSSITASTSSSSSSFTTKCFLHAQKKSASRCDDSAKLRAASRRRRRPPYPLVSSRSPSRRISPPSDSRPFCSCTRTRTRTQTRAPPWPTRRGIAPAPTSIGLLTQKARAPRVCCSVRRTNVVVVVDDGESKMNQKERKNARQENDFSVGACVDVYEAP